jgi:glycosyltransferase involved in cell wall biosynthesis
MKKNNKLKIAELAFSSKPIPSPKDRIFAPGIIINQLAEGLTSLGHKVDLFAPSDSKTKANLISFNLKSEYSQLWHKRDTTELAYNLRVIQSEQYLYSAAFEKVKLEADYDVVHCHEYRQPIYFSNFLDQPVIYTYHGNPLGDIDSPLDKLRSKRFWQNNLFVAISDRQCLLGKQYFNFIDTIHHGINLNHFKYEEKSNYTTALFAGRIVESKSPDLALESALATCTPIKICGDKGKTKKDLEYFDTKLKQHMDNKLVKFLGHIRYDKMAEYYSEARFLLMPIRWHEPFGLVMVEALASGTPVIAFNMGSAPEIVKDGVTGYIVNISEGVKGLISAIDKINQLTPEKYLAMRRACRNRAKVEFSEEKMIKNYEKLFVSLSKKRTKR